MTPGRLAVCADWGTSRLRAYLCDLADGETIATDTLFGPGVLSAAGRIEATFFETIEPWTSRYGELPVYVAGMAGSALGWQDVPYLSCPADLDNLAGALTRVESRGHSVLLVPGLRCVNDLGNHDVMRGEELQIFGWLEDDPGNRHGDWLLCLPGTHTKWATVRAGIVEGFRTAMTGELYALLLRHSVLLSGMSPEQADSTIDEDAFAQGVAAAGKGDVFHRLFSVRSRMLVDGLEYDAAASLLSGLLIGADCAAAVSGTSALPRSIAVVGESELCRRFRKALDQLGLECSTFDGGAAALKGFRAIIDRQNDDCLERAAGS